MPPTSAFLRWSTLILGGAAVLLAVTGILALLTGGTRIQWGGLRISATEPSRLFFEASACVVALIILRRELEASLRTRVASLAILLMLVTAVAESRPRRVGDGVEYIAMARQLSLLRPPSLRPNEITEFDQAVRSFDGYAEPLAPSSDIDPTNDRLDFVHFWIYSALVAPMLALVAALGLHWNYAFTVVNLVMLIALFLVVSRRFGVDVGVFITLSPIVWWVDKAHPEVLFFSGLALAVSVFEVSPAIATFALGVLAAQNPVFVAPLVIAASLALWIRSVSIVRLIPAFGVAAIHPAYNLWQLGALTPLTGALTTDGMSFPSMLLPLLDPNVGMIWAAPLFFVAWLAAISTSKSQHASVYWLCAGSAGALLLTFALSANVNHGGTPGPSRYGVWLLPVVLCLPLTIPAGGRAPVVIALLLASITGSFVSFHPRLGERFLDVRRPVNWMYVNLPNAYDPVPEIFYERLAGVESPGLVPIASDSCAKILLHVSESDPTAWPIPCPPMEVPVSCRKRKGLCYANASAAGTRTFNPAPGQPSFLYERRTFGVWSAGDDLSWLPVKPDWNSFVRTPPYSEHSVVKAVDEVMTVEAFQNRATVVALVAARPGLTPRLLIEPHQPLTWWWIDWEHSRVLNSGTLTEPAWLRAPSDANVVFLASWS